MAGTPPYLSISPLYLNEGQLAISMLLGGWARSDVAQAVAVSMAESGGNVCAIGPKVRSGGQVSRAYGHMQVLWPAHADLFDGGPESGYWMASDVNAKMGLAVFQSQGWKAWSTYTSGAYRLYLGLGAKGVQEADKAIAAAGGNIKAAATNLLGSKIQDTGNAEASWQLGLGFQGVAGDVGKATQEVGGSVVGSVTQGQTGPTSPLVRTLEVVLGGVLLAMGLFQLTRPVTAPIGRTVAKAAAVVK